MDKELISSAPSASVGIAPTGLPQGFLSGAFRLDALALNADLAALNHTEDQSGGWALLDEAVAWIVRAVAEDVKSLAAARGYPAPRPERAMSEAALRMQLTGKRPVGGFNELAFMGGIFLRGLAATFRQQGEIAAARRNRRTKVGA